MAAYRYLRIRKLTSTNNQAIEFSDIKLLASGVRIDTAATLTSSRAPDSGVLSDLQDGSLSTSVGWATADGLWIQWDFGGTPVAITEVSIGAADEISSFILTGIIEKSDDGINWILVQALLGVLYPGARQLTSSMPSGIFSNPWSTDYVFLSADKRSGRASYGSLLGEDSQSSGIKQIEFYKPDGAANMLLGVSTSVYASPSSATTHMGLWGTMGANKSNGAGFESVSGGVSFVGGTTIGIVIDFSAGTMTQYTNGTNPILLYSNLAGLTLYPSLGGIGSSGEMVDIREGSFKYPIAGADEWNPNKSVPLGRTLLEMITPVLSAQVASVVPDFTGVLNTSAKVGGTDYYSPMLKIGLGGVGRIAGTVKEKGTPNSPVAKRVRLFNTISGTLLVEKWSDPKTGDYIFDNLDMAGNFYVVSHDHLHNFNAVIADNLTPEPMP